MYILQVDFSVLRSKSYICLFKDVKMLNTRRILMSEEQCNKLKEEWIKASFLQLHLQSCNMGRSPGMENMSGNSAPNCLDLWLKEVIAVFIIQLWACEF